MHSSASRSSAGTTSPRRPPSATAAQRRGRRDAVREVQRRNPLRREPATASVVAPRSGVSLPTMLAMPRATAEHRVARRLGVAALERDQEDVTDHRLGVIRSEATNEIAVDTVAWRSKMTPKRAGSHSEAVMTVASVFVSTYSSSLLAQAGSRVRENNPRTYAACPACCRLSSAMLTRRTPSVTGGSQRLSTTRSRSSGGNAREHLVRAAHGVEVVEQILPVAGLYLSHLFGRVAVAGVRRVGRRARSARPSRRRPRSGRCRAAPRRGGPAHGRGARPATRSCWPRVRGFS